MDKLMSDLNEDNNALLLLRQCLVLFDRYINCLSVMSSECKCDQNYRNKLLFNDLQNKYKTVINNNEVNAKIIEKIKQNFNKFDKHIDTISDDQNNCGYNCEDYGIITTNNDNNNNDNEEENNHQMVVIKCEQELREEETSEECDDNCENNLMIDNVIDEHNEINANFDYISNQLITPLSQNIATNISDNNHAYKHINISDRNNNSSDNSECSLCNDDIVFIPQTSNHSQESRNTLTKSERREKIIDALNSGKTYTEVSAMFGLKYSAIYKIYKQFKTNKKTNANNNNNKLSDESNDDSSTALHSLVTRSYKVINNERRKKIIDALNSGKSYADVSEMFGEKYHSIYKIYKRYQKDGTININKFKHKLNCNEKSESEMKSINDTNFC